MKILKILKKKDDTSSRAISAMKQLRHEIERDHKSWPMHLDFIESDDYIQLFKGIKQRVMSSPKDIKYSFERKYKEYLSSLDFEKFKVILLKFKVGSHIEEHFHNKDEVIHCLQGSIKISDTVYNEQSIIKISKLEVHNLTCITNGLLVVLIKK